MRKTRFKGGGETRIMALRFGRPTLGLHFEIVLPEKRISEVKDFEIAFRISFLFFFVSRLSCSITYISVHLIYRKRIKPLSSSARPVSDFIFFSLEFPQFQERELCAFEKKKKYHKFMIWFYFVLIMFFRRYQLSFINVFN